MASLSITHTALRALQKGDWKIYVSLIDCYNNEKVICKYKIILIKKYTKIQYKSIDEPSDSINNRECLDYQLWLLFNGQKQFDTEKQTG